MPVTLLVPVAEEDDELRPSARGLSLRARPCDHPRDGLVVLAAVRLRSGDPMPRAAANRREAEATQVAAAAGAPGSKLAL
jgi:hypothetical protein